MELNEVRELKHYQSFLYSDDGFLQSFCVPTTNDEKEKINKFFWEFGFVVIGGVLSPEEVNKTVEEIWKSPNLLGKPSINRHDPNTWTNTSWVGGVNQSKGFVPNDWTLQCLWDNRQNNNVYTCFKTILGKKKLQCSIDRVGIMRPTKGIKLPNGKTVNRPEWKTDKNWLHWDQNPWSEPEFVRVQGLVALSDCTSTSGGFHCVPGFIHFFKDWANQNIKLRFSGGFVEVPAKDSMRKFTTKIPMKSGSLLIWDSRLPHGNFPNNNDMFRIVQYITMFPADDSARAAMLAILKSNLKSDVQLSDLGKKLVGAEKWSDEDDEENNVQ